MNLTQITCTCHAFILIRSPSLVFRSKNSGFLVFLPFKMVMTWPPFRINLHEINNTSTLWVFVEGSESSKAKRGNENCPLSYSGQIHQLIICTVQFASAWNYTIWHLCSAPGNGLCSSVCLQYNVWLLNLRNVCIWARVSVDRTQQTLQVLF